MKTFLFAILVALLLLSYQTEARHSCPNICTSRKRARRQCRRRNRNCKVVRCRRRKRACVPKSNPTLLTSPSPSPSTDPSVTPTSSMSPTPSASPSVSSTPSVSPTPSASPTPSTTPSSSPTPSATPSITPSPSPTPIINILSDVRGVSCPSGTSPGPFGGDNCDLTSLRVILAVAPSVRFGFPGRTSCPNNIVAGSGQAGCTICGDNTSNTVRELLINVRNNDAGCSAGSALTARIYESVEARASADGVVLCPRDFETNDGGPYITQTLASNFQNVMNDAFCI